MAFVTLVIKTTAYLHFVTSVVTSAHSTTEAISVYLFALAALLLVAIILLVIHWRHQISQRSRERFDGIVPLKIIDPGQDKEIEARSQLINTPYEKTDTSKQAELGSYNSYDSYDEFDEDYANIPHQKRASYEPAYRPIVISPVISPNKYQFYSNLNRGQNNYSNESVFSDENRYSQYDNLAEKGHSNYKVNYLKNADLI